MSDPPLTVSDLRVVGVTSRRVGTALEGKCAWLAADESADREDIIGFRPHIVFVEVADPRDVSEEHIGAVVAYGREVDSRAVLWLTNIAHASACPSSIRELFDAVLCTDPGLSARFSSSSSQSSPIGLPHAASLAALSGRGTGSGSGVGLVVEGHDPWADQFSNRVEPLLIAAAEHRFSILTMEPRASGIPPELETLCVPGRNDQDRIAFISSKQVIIAASPPQASARYMPAVVFDAVALGVPVVMARPASGGLILPRIVGFVSGGSTPSDLISTAIANGEFGAGFRDAGRSSIRHEHTYAHRLATAASAVAISLMPGG